MSRFRVLVTLLAVVLVSAFVAACGDDDNATSTPAPTSASRTATAAAASSSSATATGASSGVTIMLGFSAWPGWFPWQVAKEKGIFDEVGVKVDLTYFEGYLDSINAFAAGQLDANTQTLNDTIPGVAAGSDQRIVLVNDNSTGNDQIIADASITSVADRRGKTIGVEEGVVDHFLLLLVLKDASMTEADVNLTNLETGAAAAAFATGQMDAVAVFAPFTTQALARAGSHTLASSAEYPGSIPDHLVVSGALADEHPDDVQKLIEAWFKTLDYIAANPDEATQIMADRAGSSIADYKSYAAGTTIFTLAQNLEAFTPGTDNKHLDHVAQEESTFLQNAAFIDSAPDLSKMLMDKFVKAYAASQ